MNIDEHRALPKLILKIAAIDFQTGTLDCTLDDCTGRRASSGRLNWRAAFAAVGT